jgi:glycosyltransferase involved in cell wall biosynthesis
LLADAGRDLRLAKQWGLCADVPEAVLPGNGGLDLKEINRTITVHIEQPYQLPQDRPLVVNPRGFRPGSVHQDVFFRCLTKVLQEFPSAFFICPAMQGQPQALRWIGEYHLEEHVLLLPYLNQQQLWQLFSRSQVYVSLSSHDGTPNTFLEAMACGCFPVVGDIESCGNGWRMAEMGCWSIPVTWMRPPRRSYARCGMPNCASVPARATSAC